MGTYVYYLTYVNIAIAVLIYAFVCFQACTREQKVLSMLSVCNILIAFSACIMLLSRSSAACSTGALFTFSGGAFLGISFVMLISLISHIRVRKPIILFMVIGNIVFVTIGLTNNIHHLMYKELSFEIVSGEASKRSYTLGPVFYAYMCWYAFYMLVCIALIVHCRFRKPIVHKSLKKALTALVLAGFLCFLSFYFSTVLHTKYDYTSFSVCLGTLILLLVIYKFRAAPMRQNIEEEVLNSLEDIIIACDENNRLVYANTLAKSLYDTSESFVYGVDVYSINNRLSKLIDTPIGESVSVGSNLYLCNAIKVNSNSYTKGTIHWYKNVTSERNFIAETIRLKDNAEKETAAKNEFLSNVAEKMKAPVNEILSETKCLDTPEARAHAVEKMERNSQTLLLLADNILDYTNSETGALAIVASPYEVSKLALDLFGKFEVSAKSKNLYFKINEDKDLPEYLNGDYIRVKQIVSNIVSEAIKDTEKGGITVDIEHDTSDSNDILLKITVSDTGNGMTSEQMQEMYGSMDPAERKNANGLEVNVTQKLLDAMDGYIFVDSLPGQGTNCHLFIPQKRITTDSFSSLQ